MIEYHPDAAWPPRGLHQSLQGLRLGDQVVGNEPAARGGYQIEDRLALQRCQCF
jgi:hypothetical protein